MFAKRFFTTLLIGSLLTMPCHADPLPSPPNPVAGEVDVGAAVSPMKKGQTAPFTGVLLSPKAVATITIELNSVTDQVKIEVDRARNEELARCDARVNETKIKLDADNKVLQAQLESAKDTNVVLTKRLEKIEDERPTLMWWVGGGFVGGIVVSVLTTFALSQATK